MFSRIIIIMSQVHVRVYVKLNGVHHTGILIEEVQNDPRGGSGGGGGRFQFSMPGWGGQHQMHHQQQFAQPMYGQGFAPGPMVPGASGPGGSIVRVGRVDFDPNETGEQNRSVFSPSMPNYQISVSEPAIFTGAQWFDTIVQTLVSIPTGI